MTNLRDRLEAMQALLAPYAIPHGGRLGRETPEPEDPTRTPFQRDRDRVIHADAFRRLQGKTQVFLAGEGDHFRTRLTHTMEVAQIARDIARTLRLNEDVAETIALAHDLGHPPFGHRGEQALDAWLRAHGSSFEHNAQSLRIVTLLEEHAAGVPGLNLNREILEGLQKHVETDRPGGRSLSIEAQAVNVADEIAYCAHDCDDGLRARLFTREDLLRAGIARRAAEHAEARGTSLRGALIHLLLEDLYVETAKRLRNVASVEDAESNRAPLVGFSEGTTRDLSVLKTFLWDRMYSHERVTAASEAGQGVIEELCDRYLTSPPAKVLELQRRTGSSLPDAVKDYVAGMTDGFAVESLGAMGG